MPSIRITAFRGLKPAIHPRLLENGEAQIAVNTQLWNGQLRPFPAPTLDSVIQFTGFNSDLCFDPRYGIVPLFAANAINPIYDNQFNHTGPAYSEYTNNTTARVFYVNNANTQAQIFVAESDASLFAVSRENIVPQGPSISTVLILPQNVSPRPTLRFYAFTYVDRYGQEGMPTLLGPLQVAEGDSVTLNIAINTGLIVPSRIRYVRIYRTITDFETGEKPEQRHDTSFHLVADVAAAGLGSILTYIDAATSDQIPGDLLLSKEFHPFPSQIGRPIGFGMLESGAMAVATEDGFIAVSERYQYHAWPQSQILNLNGPIAAMSCYRDDMIVSMRRSGCGYRISTQGTEGGISLGVSKLNDAPNMTGFNYASQVVSSAGAVYPGEHGLISIAGDGATMLTRNIIRPDQWSSFWLPNTAEWCAGLYLAHRGFAVSGDPMWLVDVEDKATGSYQFGNLVTLNFAPATLGRRLPIKWCDDRVRFQVGNEVWSWQGLTRSSPSSVQNLQYRWMSKTYVYPAPVNFAAAKVVADAGTGNSEFRLIVDGVIRHVESLQGSKIFRLPHLYRGIDFEIEFVGTLVISECHVATSMTELREESQ